MRKLLVLAVLLAIIVGAAGGAAATPQRAASAAVVKPVADHCMFVMAGKNATTDGSVLMGYNNDWSANNYVYVQIVPAAGTAYKYVKLLTWGGVAEGGINEHRLAVCYGAATTLNPAVTKADPYISKGYGAEIWDTILKTCTTPQQAIDYLANCGATKGFNVNAAGSFGIADANQAWVFELFGGHHWVAARVPDNSYYAQPNMPRIRQVNLADPANFRGPADLQSFVQGLGLYDPASGPFDVAWAYGDHADMQVYSNTNRLWGITKRWSAALATDPTMPYATRPVFAVPDHLLSRADFMAFNREHYEGTQLDQTNGYALMSPHAQTNRPICCSYTDYGAVFQLRGSLPEGIGGVLWLAPSRPCSSAFVPFYCCINSVPTQWTGKTAFNGFRAVADSLDKTGTVGGELRYKHYIGLVKTTYGTFYTDTVNQQVSLEATATSLWTTNKAQAITNLTTFSTGRATAAYNLALGLPAQMP